MATKTTRYVAEEQYDVFDDTDQLNSEVEASEPRCSICGDLLAWHEESCAMVVPHVEELTAAEVPSWSLASAFAYDLGHQVLPLAGTAPRVITWRGQLKERHPETGMVYRVPVYRLDDGYWDCYREEELQVA